MFPHPFIFFSFRTNMSAKQRETGNTDRWSFQGPGFATQKTFILFFFFVLFFYLLGPEWID